MEGLIIMFLSFGLLVFPVIPLSTCSRPSEINCFSSQTLSALAGRLGIGNAPSIGLLKPSVLSRSTENHPPAGFLGSLCKGFHRSLAIPQSSQQSTRKIDGGD